MTTLSEDDLRDAWSSSIRPEDRHPAYSPARSFPREILNRRREGTIPKRQKFASECTPQLPEDEAIIRLWAEGNTTEEIGDLIKRSDSHVRRRLVECHPTATRLT